VKVGDLVQYHIGTDPYRKRGIVMSFDSDDDPVVHWFNSAITQQSHIQNPAFVLKFEFFRGLSELFTPL
jgi:hypothetical protein